MSLRHLVQPPESNKLSIATDPWRCAAGVSQLTHVVLMHTDTTLMNPAFASHDLFGYLDKIQCQISIANCRHFGLQTKGFSFQLPVRANSNASDWNSAAAKSRTPLLTRK